MFDLELDWLLFMRQTILGIKIEDWNLAGAMLLELPLPGLPDIHWSILPHWPGYLFSDIGSAA